MALSLYIRTFGCQMNVRDSQVVEHLLAPLGYVCVAQAEKADLILVNTCSVREKAEQKVFSLLGQLASLKQKKPHLKIGLMGCVAQLAGDKVFERAPYVDLVLGTRQLHRLPELVSQLQADGARQLVAIDLVDAQLFPLADGATASGHPPLPFSAATATNSAMSGTRAQIRTTPSRFVTIMQGCNNFCTYCVVPATRGRETSRPVAEILDEIRQAVEYEGAREIVLLGQNVNSYGLTNPVAASPCTFADLLHKVAAVPGIRRLRFTTSNPKDLSPELIACFAEIETLCSHFHLPVQSGSDRILKMMNRKYNRKHYINLVERLRKARPDICLATDIIVGFPGETEEDFSQTMSLLEEIRFHASFSFKYSDRPGTRAATFENKISEEVKKERLQRFQQVQDLISLEQNRLLVGSAQEIMIESVSPEQGEMRGRTGGNHIVHCRLPLEMKPPQPGDLLPVRIVKAGMHSLQGETLVCQKTEVR